MKTLLSITIGLLIAAGARADHHEGLGRLAFILGNWEGTMENPEGGEVQVRYWVRDMDGHCYIGNGNVRVGEEVVERFHVVYYLQGKEIHTRSWGTGQGGSLGFGRLSFDGQTALIHSIGRSEEEGFETGVAKLVKVSDDHIQWKPTIRIRNGQTQEVPTEPIDLHKRERPRRRAQ
jgi:hypothetical protein